MDQSSIVDEQDHRPADQDAEGHQKEKDHQITVYQGSEIHKTDRGHQVSGDVITSVRRAELAENEIQDETLHVVEQDHRS